MSFLRPVLPGLLILIAFLSSTRAQSVASSSTPAGAVSDEARQQAANALRAAGENLFGGNAAIAERAALDAVRLDPSLSSEAYPLAVEAAWQAAALPPRRPADRAHAEQLLGEALARLPLLPQLELIRARMKLHDGAIAEAEAIARAALEKFRPTASASDLRLQEASFAALVHARRGEWKPAAKLIIDSESWLPGYDFHAAAAEILEHALRDGNTSDDILRYTRNAYVGAHDFLRHRERGPEISANESRQLELLTQLGHWDLILEFLRETILPSHTGTATDAHLLSLLEPVSQAGITAFLRETEAAKKKTSVNLAALTAVDDVLASLLPRFSRQIRFIEIRFDWTHALALALLRDDATGTQKARAAQSVDAAEKLLPLLDADWRRHVSVLPLLNRLDRRSQAETFARQLFSNAVKLGVTTSEQWSALGNAIEFSQGTGTVFTEVAFSCYERAVQIDTKTNHLNFAAIIGKLRLGALNNLKPEDALDLVNQLAAQFPAEASARESEVFFVRKRLCQLIVDDRRPLDAALAYVKLAQLTPKDAFTYHYNAASSLVDYITAQSESSVRLNRTLPDVRTGFVLPSVEAIFDQMVAQYPNAPDRIFQLRAQKERLSVAIAHGAVRADTSQWSAAETTALADSIGALRLRSPAFQKDEFLQLEAFVHVSRLNAIARRSEYTQASLDEARMRRDRVIELGGPNVSVARSNYDAILSRNRQIIAARENARRQQIAEQQRQREAEAQAAAFARSQPRPEPEPRWRWCLRCSGSGYRTVWDRAQNSYTGRFETAQMNRTCDQCFGRGKLPY